MATSSISVGSLSVESSVVATLAASTLEESFLSVEASGLTSLFAGAGDASGATAGVAVESELWVAFEVELESLLASEVLFVVEFDYATEVSLESVWVSEVV